MMGAIIYFYNSLSIFDDAIDVLYRNMKYKLIGPARPGSSRGSDKVAGVRQGRNSLRPHLNTDVNNSSSNGSQVVFTLFVAVLFGKCCCSERS